MPCSRPSVRVLMLSVSVATLFGAPLCLGLDTDDATDSEALASFAACRDIDNDIARLQCYDDAVSALDLERDVETDSEGARAEAEVADASDGQAVESTERATNRPRRPTDPKAIIEADEPMVEECEFLGTVVGKSGWGGMASGAASRGSIRSAKKRAAAKGATHIVVGNFRNARSGMTVSTTQARAYACD